MVNVDGVIIGNYRASCAGIDLNRKYDKPDFRFHPIVWSIKNLTETLNEQSEASYEPNAAKQERIKEILQEDNVMAFIDMHGHSRKKGVFMYGPQVPMHSEKYLRMRVIPRLLSEETDMFRYYSCRFTHEKSKAKTARIVIHKELNITNCFTLESSFHAYFDKQNVNFEFTTEMFENMGAALVSSLWEYV